MEFDEEIREFLIESNENLALLDREIIQLEQNPKDMQLVSSAFRTIHTIKGTCGFFGYSILGSVTHITENILSQVREGQRDLTPDLISLVLESVDAVKALLTAIESTGSEGDDVTGPLRARLEQAHAAAFASQQDTVVVPHAHASEGHEAKVNAVSGEVLSPEPTQDRILALAESSAPFAEDVSDAGPLSEAGSGKTAVLPASPAAPPSSLAAQQSLSPAKTPEQTKVLSDHDLYAGKVALTALADKAPPPMASPKPQTSPPVDQQPKMAAPENASDERANDPTKDASREAQLADSTIRVDVALLNRLMNLVGELVLARNQLLQDSSTQSPALQQTSQRLNLITSELQEGVMKTRMQPIGVIWNKLPRIVRDLASQCGKRIHIEMEGANTELDKTIIEAIKDPLTHIVRNSCDHGIEMPEDRVARKKKPEGLLLLRAYHEGGVVNIEIADDGAGINPQKIKAKAVEKGLLRADQADQLSDRNALSLIFLPGFSTAAAITSISGRGVGMDVVKTNIEKIGGSVEVQNRAGGGTTIRIKSPLTLAIIPGLLVTLQDGAAEGPDQGDKTAHLRLRSTDGPSGQRRGAVHYSPGQPS